ncbi:dienelactone hydrolase family protein [Rhizobium skierniewicense]|uniref:dienelactone hydrolase family protein n=1 Tax=Rhizobium skierniewicense TaxID=984260 RepID=UPI001571A203|nr:dienelactone hydrolase family protein [Rhizobium skierniewicense]NTF33433.1 prolyl oligopeptidase family serine peptidase [Rhizobium skierniewicense]
MTAPSEELRPFLAERIATHRYPLAFREPVSEWQAELRSIWQAGLPPSGISSFQMLDNRGNSRHLLFQYASGDIGEAMLMLPDNQGPHPAILLMHDHGGVFDIGWRKMISGEAGEAHVAKHYDRQFLANDLVKQGYAILVCDAIGWGSRLADGYAEQQALAAQAMQAGWSLAGLVAADDLAAFDWLSWQPEIDPARIGTLGHSFGGFRAWQLAALEQRVRACAAVSWAGTRFGMLAPGMTLLKGQSAFYTLHPHLAAIADYPDMAALAADRPLFMRTGSEDRHFPAGSARDFFCRLEDAGRAFGKRPDNAVVPGGHSFSNENQTAAMAFLRSHLSLHQG